MTFDIEKVTKVEEITTYRITSEQLEGIILDALKITGTVEASVDFELSDGVGFIKGVDVRVVKKSTRHG